MLKSKAFLIIFFCFFAAGFTRSQSLKSGFKALEMNDYFKSKKIFDKHKRRNASIASFGLAQLYTKPQNVFQNLDSAHFYVQIALEKFEAVKAKKMKKYLPYGFEKSKLEALRQQISSVLFERAVGENTEEAFVRFINQNLWAKEIPKATFFRDSLAFNKHFALGDSKEMSAFLKKYPTSDFAPRAQQSFYQFQFQEETIGKRKEDYELFINNFPENPFVKEADRAIFRFAEDLNTVKGYEKFIASYPKSTYKSEAWRLLYRAYIKQNGLALVNEFKRSYPNYPFMSELELELSLLNTQLFPVFVDGKWGYMDINGVTKIQPKFDYAEMFSQGRAVAQSNDLYGFIDVIGQWIIRPQFKEVTPFRFNLSVVIDEKSKAGVINLFGEWILESRFEDIQIINDDWLWVEDESGWILYQISKNKFGKEHFNTVDEFVNGVAIVSKLKEYALIDLKENHLLSFDEEFVRFGDLFLVQWNDSSALISESNEVVLPYGDYSFGEFNPNGLTPFERDGMIGYIDGDGKIVIAPRLEVYAGWELFAGFVNKHAKAYQSKTKKFGLIDQNGNWLLAPKYNDVSFYSDIIAVQFTADKWEYINKNAQKLNIGVFDRAESFVEGAGIVIKNGYYGLIGPSGEELIPIEMRRLLRLSDNLLRWEDKQGKMWLGDQVGKLIINEAADKIDRLDENIIQFEINHEILYYLIKEKRIVSQR